MKSIKKAKALVKKAKASLLKIEKINRREKEILRRIRRRS